jgi:hypothetical protein
MGGVSALNDAEQAIDVKKIRNSDSEGFLYMDENILEDFYLKTEKMMDSLASDPDTAISSLTLTNLPLVGADLKDGRLYLLHRGPDTYRVDKAGTTNEVWTTIPGETLLQVVAIQNDRLDIVGRSAPSKFSAASWGRYTAYWPTPRSLVWIQEGGYGYMSSMWMRGGMLVGGDMMIAPGRGWWFGGGNTRWLAVDLTGPERPVFVFGYSQLVRGISYRSSRRVPSHFILLYKDGTSLCRLVQAAGRAMGEQASVLRANGFMDVKLITQTQDFDAIRAYPEFLKTVGERMSSGMTLKAALEQQFAGKYNVFHGKTVGQKKLHLEDLQQTLKFAPSHPGELIGATAEDEMMGTQGRGLMRAMSTLSRALPKYCGEPLSRTVTLSVTVQAGE